MTTDARNARIHAVLDTLEAARTAGVALDALPEKWQRFMAGPDEEGFHFSICPDDAPGIVSRIYDRGLAMGRGDTQMEAIAAAIQWIRLRVPRTTEAVDPGEPIIHPHVTMLPAADLETARRRIMLISQGREIAEAYDYHVDADLPVGELFRSHLSLLLAATVEEDVPSECLGNLINVAHGDTVEETYGPEDARTFRMHLRSLLDMLPVYRGPKWLAAVETDGAVTRILGIFASRQGAHLACTSLMARQAQALPEEGQEREFWFTEWNRCLDEDGVVEYHPSNGMVDPRQKLRIMPLEIV